MAIGSSLANPMMFEAMKYSPNKASQHAAARVFLSVQNYRGLDRGTFAGGEHVLDRGAEFVQPRAWHNNRVSPAMRFFSYAKELTPIILAEFHIKMLPLDLDLFRLDDVIHVRGSILGKFQGVGEAKFYLKFTLQSLNEYHTRYGVWPNAVQPVVGDRRWRNRSAA
jgi:hypothetical protein